jgi:hypothetical protein
MLLCILTIVTFVEAVCFIMCLSIANPTMKQKNKNYTSDVGFFWAKESTWGEEIRHPFSLQE